MNVPIQSRRDVDMFNAGVDAVLARLSETSEALARRPTNSPFRRAQIIALIDGLRTELEGVRLEIAFEPPP